MLVLPDSDEPLRIVSIDPGSSTMGISLLEVRFDGSNKVVVRESYTIHLRDTHPTYAAMRDLHGSRVARLLQVGDTLADLFRQYRPHVVIAEDNYMGRFAAAFEALVECVMVIRNTLYQYDRFIPLYMVEPSAAKRVAGVEKQGGGKGKKRKRKYDKTNQAEKKELVREALRKRTDIEWHVELDTLDEHSVDSVAIGYYYVKELL